MRLLILTQKVDMEDSVLGFFIRWIEEFAQRCEKVTVVCLQEGKHNLPKNVCVLSLGKEKGAGKIKRIFRFYKYIFSERKNYDAVFVHMNPEYVVLGGIFWHIWGKKTSLWYTHKRVPLWLRIAEKFTYRIFTASKESCRLKSKKIYPTGHGVDTKLFKETKHIRNDGTFVVGARGRVAPVKDYETLIDAIAILKGRGLNVCAEIVGPGEKSSYAETLRSRAREAGIADEVKFLGGVPHAKVSDSMKTLDVFANMTPTGSLDKVILEAMGIGIPTITCNEALRKDLGEHAGDLIFENNNVDDLAQKIWSILCMPEDRLESLRKHIRAIVVTKHNLATLIGKIIEGMK